MRIIEPKAEIMDEIDGQEVLRRIETAARTCYQSQDKAGEGTAERLIANCIARGHESILEHVSVSVRFITDRAIHNEMVRHRLTAVSCESTRYCNYVLGKFGDEITVIAPGAFKPNTPRYRMWQNACHVAETMYFDLIHDGATPQEARSVLPLSLKCKYIITANLREWRHVLRLRTSEAAHPDMRRIMIPLAAEFHDKIPVVFDAIVECLK